MTKFFGLHCVKLTGATQRKVRIITSDIQTMGLISTVSLESELLFYNVFTISSWYFNCQSDEPGPLCYNGEFVLL